MEDHFVEENHDTIDITTIESGVTHYFRILWSDDYDQWICESKSILTPKWYDWFHIGNVSRAIAVEKTVHALQRAGRKLSVYDKAKKLM